MSITGAFDAPAVTDQMITRALGRVCPRWGSVKSTVQNDVELELWRQIVRHHAAHLLHISKKAEQGGPVGPVASETLAQVGSRTYAQPKIDPEGEFGSYSPYLADLLGYIDSLPPAIRALTGG